GGGAATVIGPTRGSGTWSAGDVMLAGDESEWDVGGDIRTISKSGGEPTVALKAAKGEGLAFPTFLPDGQHFLVARGSGSEGGLYVGRLGSSEKTRVYRARMNRDHANV